MVKTELAKFKDDCQRFFGETSTHALGQVADDESPIGDNHPVRRGCWLVSDLPSNIRREGGQSLVIGGPSLVILEGKTCNPL